MRAYTSGAIGLALLTACTEASQHSSGPLCNFHDIEDDRITGERYAVSRKVWDANAVIVRVNIDTMGRVTHVQMEQVDSGTDLAPFLAAARTWRFHPQMLDGRVTPATGTIAIRPRLPEIPADESVPFPTVTGNDFAISLERTACYGSCPRYHVSLDRKGRVVFTSPQFPSTPHLAGERIVLGSGGVLLSGMHEARINPRAAARLLEEFRRAHFMGLLPEYQGIATDSPEYTLTLRVGTMTKQVVDYIGETAGMPASVTALEEAVDRIAGTDKWIRGNAQTVAYLKKRGFDFRSQSGTELVATAIRLDRDGFNRRGVTALITAAIREGLDLDRTIDIGAKDERQNIQPLGAVIRGYALRTANTPLADAMGKRGYAMLKDAEYSWTQSRLAPECPAGTRTS